MPCASSLLTSAPAITGPHIGDASGMLATRKSVTEKVHASD
jgi:hypothetical protein